MISHRFIMSAGSTFFYCMLLMLALNAEPHRAYATDKAPGQRNALKAKREATSEVIQLDCSKVYQVKTDGPQKYNIGKGGGQIFIQELKVPPEDYVYMRNVKCPEGNCTSVKLDNTAVAPLSFKSLPVFIIQTKNPKSPAIIKFKCVRNSDKRGRCPVPTGTGACRDSCSNDKDCPGSLKCCSNGCGRMCTAPDEVKLGNVCESAEQCAVNTVCEKEGDSKICKCKPNFAESISLPGQCVPTACRATISVILSQQWKAEYLDTSSSEYTTLKDTVTSDIMKDEAFIAMEDFEFSDENGIVKVNYVLTLRYREGEKRKTSTWTSPIAAQKPAKRDAFYQVKDLVRSSMKMKGLKYGNIDAHLVGKPEQLCYNKNDCYMENSRCISKGCACLKGISEDMTRCLA